ncbi:hypothetical protein AVEN_185659-1 [Araneus ventricosus]|uniref:Uncharacterized protein n=1 Tax=Araneus ventricosus TaxID=182803 RepID=A0A4Y2FXF6_ARAVE|nr:hypothetical protein AVEN_185659-1 [Araneus ventricosus]
MIGEDLQKFSGSRVMRTIEIGALPISFYYNNVCYEKDGDIANAFAEYFKSVFKSSTNYDIKDEFKSNCVGDLVKIDSVTYDDVVLAISGLKYSLNVGLDNIPSFIIRPKEHHPALPKHPGKQLKDRPPQQIVRHCGSCIIDTIKSGSCSTVLPGYDPSSEVGTKSHTTIIVPSGPREPAYLYVSRSSAFLRCPPMGFFYY